MGVETTRYIRKPLYVDAVRVTPQNIQELAEWCDGKIDMGYPNPNQTGKKKKYIKVNVLNPRNPRQTMAFIGDWLLRQGDSFKIYTFKAFQLAFDEAPEEPKGELQDTGKGDPVPEKKADLPPQPRHVGSNIEIHDKRDHGASTGADPEFEGVSQAQPDSDLMDAPPPGGDMFPPESPEMKEARETIEADGGTVEPATPEAIAEVVEEQQPVIPPTTDEIIENHPEGVHAGMSEAAGETPTPLKEPISNPDDTGDGRPVPEQPPQIAAEGKRVLSEHEQRILGTDEVREMVRSGDVILAQDLEPC